MIVQKVDLNMDEVLNAISDEAGRTLTREILTAFTENRLTYTIKTRWKPKGSVGEDYRIFCYIKKNKESIIINTSDYDFGGFSLQLRIADRSVFGQFDTFPKHIQEVLLNGTDCRAPNCSNDGCEYVFEHGGKTHRKCHMLCANFRFGNLNRDDISPLMKIINNEIVYGQPKRKS